MSLSPCWITTRAALETFSGAIERQARNRKNDSFRGFCVLLLRWDKICLQAVAVQRNSSTSTLCTAPRATSAVHA